MDQVRNLFCVHYPMCLDMHVRCSKRKFTCAGCQRYKPIHLEAEEVIEDALNCAEFLNALFFRDLSEEWEMAKDTQSQEFVRVPLDLIRSFQNALFLFVGNAQAIINIGNQLAQLGDNLGNRISAREEDESLEP